MDSIRLVLYHAIRCAMEIAKEVVVMKYIIGYSSRAGVRYRRVIIAFILVTVALFLCCSYVPEEMIPMFYIPAVIISYAVLTGKTNFPRFLLSLIAYICICEVDFFLSAVAGVFQLEVITGQMWNNLIMNFIGLVLIGAIGYTCKYYDISFYKQSIGKRKTFLAVEIIVILINIGIITIMFGILSEQKGLRMQLLLLVAMLMSLLLSVVILMFYCVVNSNREYKQINELNIMYLDAQKNHYERMKKMEKATRKFRHDITNHANALKGLMMDGKYEQAENYLEEISTNLSRIQPVIRTGNDIVDAIVHEKYERSMESEITFELIGVFPNQLIISDYDICTILGNVLDNAIEACQKVAGERYIRMEIRSHENMLHLIISNSMSSVGTTDFATTKRNRRNHGYGLENMSECVEKNHGELKITQAGEMFMVDIIIFAYV